MEPLAELILANRAYADHIAPPGSSEPPATGAGGLLSAVQAVVGPWDGSRGTTWIGAGRGSSDAAFVDQRGLELMATPAGPLRHRRLFFDDPAWHGHYAATSNGFLWPAFHLATRPLPALTGYFPAPATPSEPDWRAYVEVNRSFASAAAEESARTCWVHDYQLSLVPSALRATGFPGRIGFFLHTPVPSPAIARPYLETRGLGLLRHVFEGILGADLVGVQTQPDVSRFHEWVKHFDLGQPRAGGISVGDRQVRLAAYPVGIDFEGHVRVAATATLPPEVAPLRATGLPLVVGLERADYTKGIPERLRAIAEAYRRGARFAYAGFASPTRQGVASYDLLSSAIAAAASEAAEAARLAECPFLHQSAAIPWDHVVALQREADVVFTSSLADGMNLVPLQAAAAQSQHPEGRRAVILCGMDTGAANAYADCLGQGLALVDPLNHEDMVARLLQAVAGQLTGVSERFIYRVRDRDARHWATGYLNDLMGQPS